MNWSWRFAIALAFALSACATPRVQLMSPIPVLRPEKPSDIRVVTFNAGLAPGIVRLASQRQAFVAQETSRLGYDIACFQEVWTDEARTAVLQALALPETNVFHVDTAGQNETGEDRCTREQVRDIARCVERKCGHEAPEDAAACASSQCVEEGTILYLRARQCLNCLTAASGKTAAEMISTCTTGSGVSRIYGGNNGVILASRWPLLDKEVLPLPASGANRLALLARIEVPGKGKVEVACTHFSAKLAVSPTHPAFGDWTEEQQTQLRLISERMNVRGPDRPHLLIGDTNFGQRNDAAAISPLMWSTWRLAADLGFVSPAEYAEPPFCSWCRVNSLTGSNDSHLIDHVLVRNPPKSSPLTLPLGKTVIEPVCAYRVFDHSVTVTDWRGREVRTNLSDHFGVVVEFNLH